MDRQTKRIIGGYDAEEGEVPWFALITWTSKKVNSQCGGIVIDKLFILTVAHCPLDKQTAVVRTGIYTLDRQMAIEQRNAIDKIIKHPEFVERPVGASGSRGVDIALIRLKTPLQWSEYVRPACLPPVAGTPGVLVEPYTTNLTIAGYGIYRYYKDMALAGTMILPKKLRVGAIFVKNPRVCETEFGLDIAKEFCAPGIWYGTGCDGDFGGPALYKRDKKKWEVYGVMKGKSGLTNNCSIEDTTYVWIPYTREWIMHTVWRSYRGVF